MKICEHQAANLLGSQPPGMPLPGLPDLRDRCGNIKNIMTSDDDVRSGLQAMGGEEVSAQGTTATRYARNQQNRLAGRLASVRAGARVAKDEQKRDPLDFALWKWAPLKSGVGTARGGEGAQVGTSSALL